LHIYQLHDELLFAVTKLMKIAWTWKLHEYQLVGWLIGDFIVALD